MNNVDGRLWAGRLLFLLIIIFSTCCIKLCAESTFVTPAQAKEKRENFVAKAKQCAGSPYVYGAIGPSSFDCSGLVYYAAKESLNINLPRTAKALYNYCKIVDDADREAGDLVFFKTTGSGTISHVGIYIGNNQFVSALSEGSNKGVAISSLTQDYWKKCYVCAGQFIKSGRSKGESSGIASTSASGSSENANTSKKTSFADNVVFDVEAAGGWSFVNQDGFGFNFKGVDAAANVRFDNLAVKPGIGAMFRYNYQNQMIQLPVLFSLTFNDYIKMYAGPVFSFGNGKLKDKEIAASVFPGIAGVEFAVPAIKAGKTKIQLVQNISYSFFSQMDGTALSAQEMFGNGFEFSTGIRVTFPLSSFFNK